MSTENWSLGVGSFRWSHADEPGGSTASSDLFGLLGVLDHDDGPFGDGITLTDIERQETRSILLDVARRLTDRALSIESMHRRLGAIVESLISVADALDGDPDREDGADQEAVCEDEGAQCDDEGHLDDGGAPSSICIRTPLAPAL
jgi:hypothetical protein